MNNETKHCLCDPSFPSTNYGSEACNRQGCQAYAGLNFGSWFVISIITAIFLGSNYYGLYQTRLSTSANECWPTLTQMNIPQNQLYLLLFISATTRWIRYLMVLIAANAHVIVYGIFYILVHLFFLTIFSIIIFNWISGFYHNHRSNKDPKRIRILKPCLIAANFVSYIAGISLYTVNHFVAGNQLLLAYNVLIATILIVLASGFIFFGRKLYGSLGRKGTVLNLRFRTMTRLLFTLATLLILLLLTMGIFIGFRSKILPMTEQMFFMQHSIYRVFELVIVGLLIAIVGKPSIYLEWRREKQKSLTPHQRCSSPQRTGAEDDDSRSPRGSQDSSGSGSSPQSPRGGSPRTPRTSRRNTRQADTGTYLDISSSDSGITVTTSSDGISLQLSGTVTDRTESEC